MRIAGVRRVSLIKGSVFAAADLTVEGKEFPQ